MTTLFLSLFLAVHPQLTSSFDLWVKYWPDPKQSRTTLAQEIADYLSTKSFVVPVNAIVLEEFPASTQKDDTLGQHVHVTVIGINVTKQDVDHDKLAIFLGLNP